MTYDKKKFEKEFERLMNKNKLSYNPKTKEWSRKEESYKFGEEGPDIIINLNESQYEHLKDYEPSETEQELAGEMTVAWKNFKENLFQCLDIFPEDIEFRFFEAFRNVCLSLNELWETEPYDKEVHQSIFSFLDHIDMKRAQKIEKEMWFCLYSEAKTAQAMIDIFYYVIQSEISWNFPYPGYYENEAINFININDDGSGEFDARVDRDFGYLTNTYIGKKRQW